MPMPNRNIQDANGYRYAYQGQEKDPETGKEAFELRLWDGRIGRWLSPDPKGAGFSPYWGMGNNPIIMVDPTGGIPTPFEAAVMASHVYDGEIDLVGGWEESTRNGYNINNIKGGTGLHAKMYQRKRKNGSYEYAYVFAGTEGLFDKDAAANIKQIVAASKQYDLALKIARDIDVEYQSYEVTFVGHSLGGGEANYASLGTGRSSITFNPAWISKVSMNKLKSMNIKYSSAFRPSVLQNDYIHQSDP